MGKTNRKADKGNGPKRRDGILGKVAKCRGKKPSFVWRKNILGKVWCSEHKQWHEARLLSPFLGTCGKLGR